MFEFNVQKRNGEKQGIEVNRKLTRLLCRFTKSSRREGGIELKYLNRLHKTSMMLSGEWSYVNLTNVGFVKKKSNPTFR